MSESEQVLPHPTPAPAQFTPTPPARTKGPLTTPLDEAMHGRVRAVCLGMPHAVIADITGFSQESVRRYLAGHKPAAAFLARVCYALEISPAWMLLGRAAPLARSADEVDTDSAQTLEEQLGVLSKHVAALRKEIEGLAPPNGGKAGIVADRKNSGRKRRPTENVAAEQPMNSQEVHTLRLVLGPADGQTVRIERPPGEEIEVRLDAKHPRAMVVEPGGIVEPAARVFRYRRVLPQVYRWIDPVRERD